MRHLFATVALLAGLASPAAAQVLSGSYPDHYPPPLPEREEPAPPPLVFELLREIPLPGPIPEAYARAVEGRVAIPVAGGVAWVDPPEGEPRVIPDLPPPEPPGGWVPSADGSMRFRTLPEGRVEAQVRGRKGRYKPAWTLRVGGGTPSPPLLLGPRLFYASLDNQVYAVRADNGHRLWVADVGSRVARPLSSWSGQVLFTVAGGYYVHRTELVLCAPEDDRTLLALDPYNGAIVATLKLPEDHSRFTTPPLPLPEGRVAIGRQYYEDPQAGLMVLALHAGVKSDVSEVALPYNEPRPAESPAATDPPKR